MGIDDIKKFVEAVARSATAIGKILADGEVNWKDMVYVPDLFMGIRSFAGIDYKAILPQSKDIDDTERAELAKLFRDRLAIDGGTTEATVEQGFELILMALQAIFAFVEVSRRTAAAG